MELGLVSVFIGFVCLLYTKIWTPLYWQNLVHKWWFNFAIFWWCKITDYKFGAKSNNILIDGISFIEKVSFNAFHEGTRLRHCISLAQKLTGVPVKKVGGDQGYSGNDNRTFCKDNNIETSFTQKGKAGTNEVKNATKRELARVRATAMEGSFGTQKEHYGLRKIAARIKSTEIMLIFFGIHTANVVNLARRESIQLPLTA